MAKRPRSPVQLPVQGFVRARRQFWNPDKHLRADFPLAVLEEIEWTYATHPAASPKPQFIVRAVIRTASLSDDLLARWDWGKGRTGFIRVYILKRDNNPDTYQQLARIADARDRDDTAQVKTQRQKAL